VVAELTRLGEVVSTRVELAARLPVTLARGEHDPMNTDEQLARLSAPAVTLPVRAPGRAR